MGAGKWSEVQSQAHEVARLMKPAPGFNKYGKAKYASKD